VLPARAISIKNKHLLVIYSIPTRGFTAAVSVFMGTPPAKPLICKSLSIHLGALVSGLWAEPTGEEFCILVAIFRFVSSDIIEMSFYVHSQAVHLWLLPVIIGFREMKNPARVRQAGCRNFISILYLPAWGLSKLVSGVCPRYAPHPPKPNTQPWLNRP